MSQYLSFNFNINDPEFKTLTNVINNSETNYLSHSFIQTPIYDNFNVKIGHKVSDDYIQQLDTNLYAVRINATYFFLNGGTISWRYSFYNNAPNYYYPLNVDNVSNIISTTGEYYGKTGVVSLKALEDGSREVKIGFNF
jgi:hypothetical protein